MKKVINNLVFLRQWKFFILGTLLAILFFLLINILISIFSNELKDLPFLKDKSIFFIFFLTVIFAPIFETFFFQKIIIDFLKEKLDFFKPIFISSFIFALFHIYSVTYFIATFFLGLIFGFFYAIANLRKDISPFFFVVYLHALLNFISFILNDILKFSYCQ